MNIGFPTVYPTLDISDDEDFPVFKPRGKKKEDEAWNPKARVRVQGPRPERPMRQGVRRQAVEKGLEQAAARRQNLPVSHCALEYCSVISTCMFRLNFRYTTSRALLLFPISRLESVYKFYVYS